MGVACRPLNESFRGTLPRVPTARARTSQICQRRRRRTPNTTNAMSAATSGKSPILLKASDPFNNSTSLPALVDARGLFSTSQPLPAQTAVRLPHAFNVPAFGTAEIDHVISATDRCHRGRFAGWAGRKRQSVNTPFLHARSRVRHVSTPKSFVREIFKLTGR